MRTATLFLALSALPALATELPPMIPSGPVQYDGVTYSPALPTMAETRPEADGLALQPAVHMPVLPTTSSEHKGYVNLNAWSSHYQVRGMGLTENYTHRGYSSLSGSYILPNRNLFGRGLQQRLGGELGAIWGAGEVLGDTPMVRFDYAVGKQIFPNAVAELGYSLHHGGLEGAFAHASGACPHRLAQDVNLGLRYDDRQRGFFGHALWGLGWQGLTGSFFDAEVGYRFTNVLSTGHFGADAEVSLGASPSFGYWGGGVEGVDAYSVKVALPLFTHNGTLGHDAHPYLRPWVSYSLSGSNAGKIDRVYGSGPIAHSQLTFGVDCGWNF